MSELSEKLEREVLPLVTRPSRYTGGERNLPRKDPASAGVSFLLAFPDVYEIGMSHLGIRVLYDILNRRPDVVAERVFAPWPDMERLMREKGIPLFSIETRRPARAFDVIGVTLQYELHYTNVLTMLDLAGLPLRSEDRSEGDPLVVGGGPCAFNPEPVSAFFDVIVVGDGESAVLDLADLVVASKRDGASRRELLERAARVPGFYVPALYREAWDGGVYRGTEPACDAAPGVVVRRVEPELGYDDHPCPPIVPVTEVTHDRLAIEIMRGCTRGCRFCQPGMVTRPVRTRPVEDVLRLVEEGMAASGFDEVSLVSLSPSDYEDLPMLVTELNRRLFDRRVSISLPSLRTDRFGQSLANGIGRVRKAGLTFAPEAGTQRLRDVINKNETEENILESVDAAFASGWNRVKLYFMIGLPTETDEDLVAIGRLVRRVREVAWRRKRGARINVSVSPFVPKAHTPFQWERQDAPEETLRKEKLLRPLLGMRGVRVSYRDPYVSYLEGVMARGDRRLADVIEAAWRGSARFEGWSERFDFDLWRRAFDASGVDPEAYVGPLDPEAALPWDHIFAGPSKAFLLAERTRAYAAETTPDCREESCTNCGACGEEGRVRREMPPRVVAPGAGAQDPRVYGRRQRRHRAAAPGASDRWRVRYAKGESVRFLSHLDVLRALARALSASGLPVAYSQGFNPHAKLSLGPPLPVGATGEAEFLEIELVRPVPARDVVERLSACLPDGLRVLGAVPLRSKRPSAAEACATAYEIRCVAGCAGMTGEELDSRASEVRNLATAEVPKGEGTRVIRPRERILDLAVEAVEPPTLRAVLALGAEGSLRPRDVVFLLTGSKEAAALARVHRRALYRRTSAGQLEEVR